MLGTLTGMFSAPLCLLTMNLTKPWSWVIECLSESFIEHGDISREKGKKFSSNCLSVELCDMGGCEPKLVPTCVLNPHQNVRL